MTCPNPGPMGPVAVSFLISKESIFGAISAREVISICVMVICLAFHGGKDGFKRKNLGGIFLPSETAWVWSQQFAHQVWSEIGSFGCNDQGRCRNLWHEPCLIVLRNPHQSPFS